jgi:nitrogen PTS system EIIA component
MMEYSSNSNNIMTLSELAEYLKLSEKTILKMVKNHEIPCAKIANQWRFLKPMVDDWLISQMNVIPQNDLSRQIEMEYEYFPLYRLMDEQLIDLNLDNNSKEEVLNNLVELTKKKKLISDDFNLLDKLLDREKLISTGIGNGIALPHLRKPSSKFVYGPKIIIGISKKGIDFNSLDKKPVYLVFLILTDSEIVHLRVMAKLTNLLRENNVVDKLKKTGSPEEVIKLFINIENKHILGEKI